MEMGNVKVVMEFLNSNTTRPCNITEIRPFWQACTLEEKVQFANESRALLIAANA
jgi:hypothetical protein